jgi:hypothetical protein
MRIFEIPSRAWSAIACACCSILLSSCAPQMLQGLEQTANAADDAVFTAVVDTLIVDTSFARGRNSWLTIDHRPLRRDESVGAVTQESFAATSPAELATRLAILREHGIKSGDATFPDNCPGISAPMPTASNPSHQGCPKEGRFVIAVAHPRNAPATMSQGDANPRIRIVRVILASLGAGGIGGEVRDYVLEGMGREWKVSSWRRLNYIE